MKVSVKDRVKQYMEGLPKRLVDEKENKKIVGFWTNLVLCIVAAFMTLVNILTAQSVLTYVTAVCSVLCLINTILIATFDKVTLASILLGAELFALFIFFIITGEPRGADGNPEGFAIIWVCLLPSVGMLFYGRKVGIALSGAMFAILIFFLWTPFGKGLLQYEYSLTLKMRFPLLFLAFLAMAFLLETLRAVASKQVQKLSESYKALSVKDQLTQVFNREGLKEEMEKRGYNYNTIGVSILDIDFFKSINDKYGHSVGDEILKDFAKILQENLDAIVCRWGGEEFAIIYYDNSAKPADFEKARLVIQNKDFACGDVDVKITASMGVFETTDKDPEHFNEWVNNADKALYRAKENGRNQVVYF